MAGTVTVACKIPNGIVLTVYRFVEEARPVMGGGYRMEKVARAIGESVTLRGYSKPYGEEPRAQIIGGYALTPGVDGDFWELWWNQNRDADYVRNGLVFAQDKHDDVAAEAREKRDSWDGLAPLIPDTDRRIPKRRNKDGKLVSAIEKFDGKDD